MLNRAMIIIWYKLQDLIIHNRCIVYTVTLAIHTMYFKIINCDNNSDFM